MQSDLKNLIQSNLTQNNEYLLLGRRKKYNQKEKEKYLKKIGKKFLWGLCLSGFFAGMSYGSITLWGSYNNYMDSQKRKIYYYQQKFDEVKKNYQNEKYLKADELIEKLKSELESEWFFSPAQELCDKVKSFDEKYIDPEIKRIEREKFYTSLKNLPSKIIKSIDYWWEESSSDEKLFVLGIGSLMLYIFKKRKR